MLQTEKIKYQDGSLTLEGHCAFDPNIKEKRPGILVAPTWAGRDSFLDKKAEELAKLGYAGFALDMFGMGKVGNTKEEKSALIQPFVNDRNVLRGRILSAFEAIKTLPFVDSSKIGAIGFCFGGLCVLDLARSGADIKGVVSFHGLLQKPEHLANNKILAKVLALHGHDDPMVPPEAVLDFEKEMTQAEVDWQVHVYGKTMHAFTNPQANDPGFGTVYNERTASRAWRAMEDFFKEIL